MVPRLPRMLIYRLFCLCRLVATPMDRTPSVFIQLLTTTRLAKGGKCAGESRFCHYPADINAVVTCATLMSLYSLTNADLSCFANTDCFKAIISSAILREALQHL